MRVGLSVRPGMLGSMSVVFDTRTPAVYDLGYREPYLLAIEALV